MPLLPMGNRAVPGSPCRCAVSKIAVPKFPKATKPDVPGLEARGSESCGLCAGDRDVRCRGWCPVVLLVGRSCGLMMSAAEEREAGAGRVSAKARKSGDHPSPHQLAPCPHHALSSLTTTRRRLYLASPTRAVCRPVDHPRMLHLPFAPTTEITNVVDARSCAVERFLMFPVWWTATLLSV